MVTRAPRRKASPKSDIDIPTPPPGFREFFEARNARPFPGMPNEQVAAVMHRLADTMADWADEIARRAAK